MIALLGRELVNLPLLCGIAEHSHDASGPLTRGAFSSFLRAGVSSFFLGWFTDCQGPACFCICPLFIPSWVSSFLSQLCDPFHCTLPFLIRVINAPAPLSGPAAVVTPPHCALPEASARTRCRLMASSRNPATFSLSSYTAHRTFLRIRYELPIPLNEFLFCLKMQKSQKGHLKIVLDQEQK